jgi:hypothetical protein
VRLVAESLHNDAGLAMGIGHDHCELAVAVRDHVEQLSFTYLPPKTSPALAGTSSTSSNGDHADEAVAADAALCASTSSSRLHGSEQTEVKPRRPERLRPTPEHLWHRQRL